MAKERELTRLGGHDLFAWGCSRCFWVELHPRPLGLDAIPSKGVQISFAQHRCEDHPALTKRRPMGTTPEAQSK